METNSKRTITAAVTMQRWLRLPSIMVVIVGLFAGGVLADADKKSDKDMPTFVKVKIGHRIHADFKEEASVKMNEQYYIGDTEFSFKATEFYPHFGIVDSTSEIISLSDELKNPAFKILVYENDELIDETWAFYAFDAPHYARTSHISFQVEAFEYRGTVHEKKTGKDKEDSGEDEAHAPGARESEG
jgi:hypothetical protein